MRRSTRIAPFALDLHVLGTPPAFVLSQDQTLQLKFEGFEPASVRARLRDSRLRCSGHLRIDSRRLSLRCRLELTAVSAICLLWACYLVFKDRAACCFCGFVLPSFYFSAAPHSTSGLHSLFRSGLPVKRPLSLRFTASPRLESTSRRGALFLPFEEGRGTYFASASRVNLLRRLFFRLVLAASLARPLPLRGGAASTTTALGVNPLRRLRISSFTSFVRGTSSPVRLRLSVRRGAASIASPPENQPLVLPG